MAGEEDNEAGLGRDDPELGDGELEVPEEGANEFDIPEEIYAKLNDTQRAEIPNGWRPRDMWPEEKDPDDWVSASRYREKGEMLSAIGKLKDEVKESSADIDKRMKNATMFLSAQNNLLRAELEEKRDGLIKEGDVDGVKAVDKQLKDIPEDEKETSKASDNTLLLDWKSNNPWVFDESSEKFKFADNHFKIAGAKGMSMKDSLSYVEEKMGEQYPDKPKAVNSRRNEPGLGEGGGKTPSKQGNGMVARSSWTFEEKQIAESLEGDFTAKEIDQMVADSRRAQA